MGHHELRHDKECQNCGHIVEIEYCSKCGQQNTETRQSFHHLITHTIEDITHYDGNFWKTIKYLLFRPGKLTIEYLMGHRMRYVPPVKLYIFISFVCFFLMAVMAPDEEEEHTKVHSENTSKGALMKEEEENKEKETDTIMYNNIQIHNVHQLDSLQNALPENKKMHWTEYYGNKIDLKAEASKMTQRDIVIAMAHTLPKVLFAYMPIFAFWLWIFHGKRRWYFFDHGIFTLHYFSFLLLVITINMIIVWISEISDNKIYTSIFSFFKIIVGVTAFFYPFFYFFRAHSRFYGESKAISRLKSFVLFFINVFIIFIMLLLTAAIIILGEH